MTMNVLTLNIKHSVKQMKITPSFKKKIWSNNRPSQSRTHTQLTYSFEIIYGSAPPICDTRARIHYDQSRCAHQRSGIQRSPKNLYQHSFTPISQHAFAGGNTEVKRNIMYFSIM